MTPLHHISVRLTNQTYLLPGTGEGGVLVDADPATDEFGLPFVPGRTFKGLLREAVMEVLEIEGKEEEEIRKEVEALFGREGEAADEDANGTLKFDNLRLEGYDQIRKELPDLSRESEDNGRALHPDSVKQHFCREIQSTQIDGEGIVLDHSLRNFRAIRPGITFSGNISSRNDLSDEWGLLQRAALQLRFAGTRRNRGFGHIEVVFEEDEPSSDSETATSVPSESKNTPIRALEVTITTQSGIIMTESGSNPNTISTAGMISGTRMRGLIAQALLTVPKEQDLQRNPKQGPAHERQYFYDAILSGQVRFLPAYPTDALPLPLNIHREKSPAQKAKDIFSAKASSSSENPEKPQFASKAIGGLAVWPLKGEATEKIVTYTKAEPAQTARFHLSRPDRTAGTSKEGSGTGSIFYYESLNGGQEFRSWITGPEDMLTDLAAKLPQSWETRMGKSKGTQYGAVRVQVTPSTTLPVPMRDGKQPSPDTRTILLHFHSPALLYNEAGFPSPDIDTLEQLLQSNIRQPFTIQNAATNYCEIEHWNREWKGRTGRVPALAAGSVLQLEFESSPDADLLDTLAALTESGIGEMRHLGYGWISFKARGQHNVAYQKDPEETEGANPDKGQIHATLQGILTAHTQEQRLSEARLHGMKKVRASRPRPHNHLLRRLETQLSDIYGRHGHSSHQFLEQLEQWLETIRQRPAGESLRRIKWEDDLKNFEAILPTDFEADNPVGRLHFAYAAWIACIAQARMLNKRETRFTKEKTS